MNKPTLSDYILNLALAIVLGVTFAWCYMHPVTTW